MTQSHLIGRNEIVIGETGVIVVSEPPEEYVKHIARLQRELMFLRQEVDRLSEYRHLAMRDDLTGLYNRRSFMDRLAEEWSRSRRYRTPLTLAMIDLDRFKLINDVCGHAVGDQVLHFFADVLCDSCRDFDVPARISGDEFAFILPNTDLVGAEIMMGRVLQNLQAAAHGPDLPANLQVAFSHGVAQVDFDRDVEPETVLIRADAAMYERKHAHKAARQHCVKLGIATIAA